MPFTNEVYVKRLSDLVVNELDPVVGYARQDLNVTPPEAASDGTGATVELGTVVYRAKGSANTAETAYTVLDGSAALVDTNEFAVVYGDHFSFNPSFVPRAIATGNFNAVGFVGKNGALRLKEYFVKQVAQDSAGAALTDAQFEVLRELLKAQGILLEITL